MESFIECCRTGHCCGLYRNHSNDKHSEGIVAYVKGEKIPEGVETTQIDEDNFIPVNEKGTCIYLEKLNNGFTKCSIYEKRPKMCRLYNCLTEKKIRYLGIIIEELKSNGCTDTNIIE